MLLARYITFADGSVMAFCPLIQLENGKWWCPLPGCDDRQKHLLPVTAMRRCKSGVSLRDRIERETIFFVKAGTATQTADQIAATLDRCFGGCEKFDGNVCKDGRSTECRRRQHWIERLVLFGCKRCVRPTARDGMIE